MERQMDNNMCANVQNHKCASCQNETIACHDVSAHHVQDRVGHTKSVYLKQTCS